ncbi:Uncharacterised protein [Burkholderia pseudomallei]|nr:Uncharacterised protein [Burkholderia pseudomallei]VBJ87917.1 Uncharacterised protein [Burkholderia pseudomallei]
MKRIDSGSAISSAPSASGAIPPTMNTLRHPCSGISAAATRPPADEPSVKPQNIVLTRNERFACGAYSAISVVAFGIAAPSPSPVSSRSTASSVTDCVKAQPMLKSPNSTTEPTSTRLRPIRSASGPAASAPSARPTSAALITGPSAAFVTCHCWASAGATKPIAAVSKPSAATIRKHRIRISH